MKVLLATFELRRDRDPDRLTRRSKATRTPSGRQ